MIPLMIYQDPLAYLLGLEGIALLDAWAGDHDRAFTEARLAEIRRLLDDEQLRDRGVLVDRVSTAAVYAQVSAGYDADAGGGLFAADEPVVAEYLACREPGVALDAACGTRRIARSRMRHPAPRQAPGWRGTQLRPARRLRTARRQPPRRSRPTPARKRWRR